MYKSIDGVDAASVGLKQFNSITTFSNYYKKITALQIAFIYLTYANLYIIQIFDD